MILRSFVALVAATTLLGPCPLSSSSSDPPRAPSPPALAVDVHFEPSRRVVDNLLFEDVAVSFDLVNATNHSVRLTKVACRWGNLRVDTPAGESFPACKLDGGLPSPLTIAGGAHVALVVAFNGELACEPSSREEFSIRAWIDDASEPVEAAILWWRHQLQAVHGGPIELGVIDPREMIERRITIESEELGHFEVNYAGIPSDARLDPKVVAALDVKGRDVTPAGAVLTAYEVVVRIDASKLPYGECFLQIVASLPRARVRRIPIDLHWKLPPPFELLLDGAPVGDGLLLGLVRSSDALLHRVAFHSRDPSHPVHVRAAGVEPAQEGPTFSIAVGPFTDGDTPLDLALTETPKTRVLRGELVVETDDPRAPEWRKRFSGLWNAATPPPTGK